MNIGLMKPVNIIIAVDQRGGIAKDGKIPWHYPEDFKHFKEITMGHVCVMGRNTYEEILELSKDKESTELLKGRECFVLSSTLTEAKGATIKRDIRHVVDDLVLAKDEREVFILGGEKILIEALPWTKRVYLTLIDKDFGCDKFFRVGYLDKYFTITAGKKSEELNFVTYERNKR